jgi:hypothetical protein
MHRCARFCRCAAERVVTCSARQIKRPRRVAGGVSGEGRERLEVA